MSALPAPEPEQPTRLLWLTADQRTTLHAIAAHHRDTVTCLPATGAALDGLLTELDVVEARDILSPAASAVTRQIGRLDQSDMPLRLTADELHVAASLPNLPDTLFDRLHQRRP